MLPGFDLPNDEVHMSLLGAQPCNFLGKDISQVSPSAPKAAHPALNFSSIPGTDRSALIPYATHSFTNGECKLFLVWYSRGGNLELADVLLYLADSAFSKFAVFTAI